MTSLDKRFHEYFESIDRAGDDRCYLCRRTPAEVKAFFGFAEDGTPLDAERYGIEDVVLYKLDIMSYKGSRPICAVCQLNFETIFLAGDHHVLHRVMSEVEHERDRLWSDSDEPEETPDEENESTEEGSRSKAEE